LVIIIFERTERANVHLPFVSFEEKSSFREFYNHTCAHACAVIAEVKKCGNGDEDALNAYAANAEKVFHNVMV